MIIEIFVSSKDIRLGNKKSCNSCPIALALMRVIEIRYLISVFEKKVEITSSQSTFELDLPLVASQFIEDFDKGRVRTPFTFKMDIPNQFLRDIETLEIVPVSEIEQEQLDKSLAIDRRERYGNKHDI